MERILMRRKLITTAIVIGALFGSAVVFGEFGFGSPFPFYPDNIQLVMGGDKADQASAFDPDTSNEQLLLGVGGGSTEVGRQLILTEIGNIAKDHDHATTTNPTLFVHSATDPDSANTQYVSAYHDASHGYVTTGYGNLVLETAGNAATFQISGDPFAAMYYNSGLASILLYEADNTSSMRLTTDSSAINGNSIVALCETDPSTTFSAIADAKYVVAAGQVDVSGDIDADLDLSAGTKLQFYTFDPTTARLLTLPQYHRPGQMITVLNKGNGWALKVNFDAYGSQTINGNSTSGTFYAKGSGVGTLTVMSDGANWWVIGVDA